MAENLQDSYIAEVANSDNDQKVNSSEQIALVFLEKQKEKLPPEQFKRLLDSTILILQRKGIEKDTIRGECEKALQELLLSIDKGNRVVETEQFLVQELDIDKDTKISLNLIEGKIQKGNIDKIKKISDFLLSKFNSNDGFCPHLFGDFSINILSLHGVLNKIQIEKQKGLLNTKMITFIELKGKTKEEALKMVDEINQGPEGIDACNTSMLQHILGILDKHGIKDINFKDKDSLVDIIEAKVAIEKSVNEGRLQSFGINPEDLKDIKTEEDALKLAAINKLDPEQTQQLLQELQRKEQIKKQQESAEIFRNTNKAEFNYLITTLQNGGDPKAAMQGMKSMQEERIQQEKQNSDTSTKLTRYRSINTLEIGQEASYRLSRSSDSESQDKVRVKKVGDNNYEFQVARHDPVTLTEKETQGYLKSFRFLENSGLGYLVRAIPPKQLSNIIALAGKDGHRVDNKDGDFTENERFYFLRTFGKVLGINKIERTINFEEAKELFKKTLYHSGNTREGGLEKIARDRGLVGNLGFNTNELERRMKGVKQT